MMNTASLQYYTDRAEASLAQVVRGISSAHEQFGTDYLGDPAQDDDNRACVRLVAWRKPGEAIWKIDRYTMLGAALGHAVKKEPETKTGLCFFDALDYCAVFQMTETEIGKIVFPAADAGDDVVHFRDAARGAGQVFDKDGRVQPCAFGQILGDGFFSQEDIATARQTRMHVAMKDAPVQTVSGAALLLGASTQTAPTGRSDKDIIDLVTQKGDLVRAFRRVIHTGTEMVGALEGAMQNNFSFNPSIGKVLKIGVATIATAGYLPVKHLLQGDESLTPVKGFYIAKDRFMKAVQTIPQEQGRKMFEDFAVVAETGFQMEWALSALKSEKKSQRVVEKAMSRVEAACRLAGYSDADTLRIQQAVANNAMVPGEFYKKISNQWDPFLSSARTLFHGRVKFDWSFVYDVACDVTKIGGQMGFERRETNEFLEKRFEAIKREIKHSYINTEGFNAYGTLSSFSKDVSACVRSRNFSVNNPSLVNKLHTQIYKHTKNRLEP